MNKKGVLLTLGITLVMIVILSLAVLFHKQTIASNDRLINNAMIDRVYDLDVSAQNCLKEIFNSESGIVVTKNQTVVSFYENIPNNNADFATAINEFVSFAESNTTISFDITNITNNIPLIVPSHNLIYNRDNISSDTLYVTGIQNVTKISLHLTFSQNITSCDWNTQAGNKTFEIYVQSTGGINCDDIRQIDPGQTNTVTINTVTITIDQFLMSIMNTGSSIPLQTTLFLKDSNEQTNVLLGGDIIQILFDEFNISKLGGVTIL